MLKILAEEVIVFILCWHPLISGFRLVLVFGDILQSFDVLCNISFKEHLPEDGHNRWPKHVGGYAVL